MKHAENIVKASQPYTYELMLSDIHGLVHAFPFLNVTTIGKSVLGKEIFAISIGHGQNEVTYNASHHGAEWITSLILMKFIEDYSTYFSMGTNFYGFNLQHIFDNTTIRIVPMVNPDGVNLNIRGLTSENMEYHDRLLKWNNGSYDFTHWSANIHGVDLNHNYDAFWEVSRKQEPKYSIFGPSASKHSGENAESEPETKALADFTRAHDFRLVIAFHSQGEEIYWDFANKATEEAHDIAKKFRDISGYRIMGIAPGAASVGGYKDWFINKFNRPGFTVEVGLGENPLPMSQFEEIYKKNVSIMLLGAVV
ncbi:MAG TPA: peptidase M14 [Lachnospiraceae bacterium]|nr:peptidase M14 [Lachnospiraceae bacterium]